MITRRSAIWMTLGFSAAAASQAKDFWSETKPSDWTAEEVQQMLTKSPWAKEASIFDSAAHKGLSTAPQTMTSRRSGRSGSAIPRSPLPAGASLNAWTATVRWDSALPVREAMKASKIMDFEENYVIALLGDIPGVGVPSDDDDPAESKQKLDVLKERTSLERKNDPLELQQVKIAPRTAISPAGTLFYFSRVLPIRPDDRQITFVTKVGPLEVKCKFTLRDMIYRGNLEL